MHLILSQFFQRPLFSCTGALVRPISDGHDEPIVVFAAAARMGMDQFQFYLQVCPSFRVLDSGRLGVVDPPSVVEMGNVACLMSRNMTDTVRAGDTDTLFQSDRRSTTFSIVALDVGG